MISLLPSNFKIKGQYLHLTKMNLTAFFYLKLGALVLIQSWYSAVRNLLEIVAYIYIP